VVKEHRAEVVGPKQVTKFCNNLGNPEFYLVEKPDKWTRSNIKPWITSPQDIPESAQHMVVKRCFFPAKESASFDYNIIEVDLLEQFGMKMLGYSSAYYPVHKVRNWIEKYCKRGRTKQLLSALNEPDLTLSQDMYDYQDSPTADK
jgi:hypothetical protein